MRYVSRPRANKPLFVETPLWEDVEPARIDVTVDDAKEVDTGLIDSKGYPIYRLQAPIGFGRN